MDRHHQTDTPALPFGQPRELSENERTEAVRALLAQGFSIGDIWEMAPSLLSETLESDGVMAICVPRA